MDLALFMPFTGYFTISATAMTGNKSPQAGAVHGLSGHPVLLDPSLLGEAGSYTTSEPSSFRNITRNEAGASSGGRGEKCLRERRGWKRVAAGAYHRGVGDEGSDDEGGDDEGGGNEGVGGDGARQKQRNDGDLHENEAAETAANRGERGANGLKSATYLHRSPGVTEW